jgi:hypothetical protein
VRTATRGGLLRPRTRHLLIGGRDRTVLIDGIKGQLDEVSRVLVSAGESVDVRGALCMVNVDALPLLERLSIDGVAIEGPKRVGMLADRAGTLSVVDVERIAETLARAFPPA